MVAFSEIKSELKITVFLPYPNPYSKPSIAFDAPDVAIKALVLRDPRVAEVLLSNKCTRENK